MKKKLVLKLDIPKPCHEDWNNMTPNEQGRHCVNCNKTVIDFSLYSDRQLVEFFKKVNGNICGKFNAYQVSAPILVAEQANRSFFYKLFFGTAIASWLGLAGTANAQSTAPAPVTQQDTKQVSDTAGGDSKCHFKGLLLDSITNQPMPYTSVKLVTAGNDSVISFSLTDYEGQFDMLIADEFVNKPLALEFLNDSAQQVTVDFIYTGDDNQYTMFKEGQKPINLNERMEGGVVGGCIASVTYDNVYIPSVPDETRFFPANEEGYVSTILPKPSTLSPKSDR